MQIDHFAEALDASQPLSIDANSLLAHHLLITGATGSGKSTSL
ncbi:helicase HerA domain-containing protein [Leuconostoc citreum]